MQYKNDICSKCGKSKKVVVSSNPLVSNICAECIANSVDIEKAENIKLISETLQIPFDLNEYYSLLMAKGNKLQALEGYLDYLQDEEDYKPAAMFDWKEIDKHYNQALSHARAIATIEPLKNSLLARGQEKWGAAYTFQQLVSLERIYESTLKQFNIVSPLQQDAVKKAAKISLRMDDLIAAGEFKETKDATKAYMDLLKTAGLDDLGAITENDGTVYTVNDLVAFFERTGFEFSKYVPNVPEDIIDKTLNNYTENVKRIVYSATGLNIKLQDAIENIQKEHEEAKSQKAYDDAPIAAFYEEADIESTEFDNEIEQEEFSFEDDIYDEL